MQTESYELALKHTREEASEEIEKLRKINEQLNNRISSFEVENQCANSSQETSVCDNRVQQLTLENKDLTDQLVSWQEAHASVARNLAETFDELVVVKSKCQMHENVESKMKDTRAQLEELTEVKKRRDTLDTELQTIKLENEKLQNLLNEKEAAIPRLLSTVDEMQQTHEITERRMQEELKTILEENRELTQMSKKYTQMDEEKQAFCLKLQDSETNLKSAKETIEVLERDKEALNEGIQKLLERAHKHKENVDDYIHTKELYESLEEHHQQLKNNTKDKKEERSEMISFLLKLLKFENEKLVNLGLCEEMGVVRDTSSDTSDARASKTLSTLFMEFLETETRD